ncbi:MAG: rhomboid family intramembrane serine protease [Bacteroidales bacterium]|jgi:membrane associated rhomboid family serine protease|nr:rhomboid family intramembrane serine protease [Bacteroidales bacterium]MCI1786400.1 rhomboid family intramembrane serine protease [Bacteroidales bacterium]
MAYYYDNNGYGRGFGGFFGSIPPVTKNIILINILVFVATLINQNFMVGTFALFYPASPYFHFWQVVTHMFMHGGFWHIFFNMYTLLIFGMVLERTIGSKKFLIFYFVTGLGAAAMHLGVEYIKAQSYLAAASSSVAAMTSYHNLLLTPTLGASGAIYGVLIGYAMLFPNSVLTLLFPPISLKAKWFVLIFAVIELGTGVFGTSDGIAHFAHLGGMLFGYLLILYWKKTGKLFMY